MLTKFHSQLDELEILLPHRKDEIDIIEAKLKIYTQKIKSINNSFECIIM